MGKKRRGGAGADGDCTESSAGCSESADDELERVDVRLKVRVFVAQVVGCTQFLTSGHPNPTPVYMPPTIPVRT